MKYSVAELFCGCGGFSHGFAMSGRFDVVLGNDIKPEALNTFKFNHWNGTNNPAIIPNDIRTVSLEHIEDVLTEQGVMRGELDCLIGGPPCQGFSQLRRSEVREHGNLIKFRGYSKLAEDPRNDLVLRFLEITEYLQPKFVVIENVPQMLSHGFHGRLGKLAELVTNILERDLGYSVSVAVLNAANYGVPQLRQRAIFIASSIGTPEFPNATHCDPSRSDLLIQGLKPWNTVMDAIQDLPDPSLDIDELGGREPELYEETKSEYAKNMRSSGEFPYNHLTRRYKKSVLDIIKEMRQGETWDAASQRMRANYDSLIQSLSKKGITARDAEARLIADGVINPSFYKDYYWSAYSRLAWDEPALTITANSNFLGSGRFTHPTEMRGITMREAARLQSFDDNFRFFTSSSDLSDTTRIGVGMDMIGEAVPPLLGKAISEKIAIHLDTRYAPATNRI